MCKTRKKKRRVVLQWCCFVIENTLLRASAGFSANIEARCSFCHGNTGMYGLVDH